MSVHNQGRKTAMIRRFGKNLYACAYSWSRASRWSPARDPNVMPFIVGYHRVVQDFRRATRHAIPSLLTSTAMLERHLDWLSKRYELISLDEVGLHLESDRPFRRPATAITFDDGYSDVYRNAFPILRRKGIPAAVFPVTDLVGTNRMQVYDKLFLLIARLQTRSQSGKEILSRTLIAAGVNYREMERLQAEQKTALYVATLLLTRLPQDRIEKILAALEQEVHVEQSVFDEMSPLSWEMIAEMHRSGFTIGSHTMTHALLSRESPPRAHAELLGSKQALEGKLNCEVKHFAYPDGRFNSSVVNAVKSSGYHYAYGICRVRDPRYPLLTIPRKVLWEGACLNAFGQFSPAVMDCHANWAFDSLHRCEHDHGVSQESCQDQLIAA